MFRRILFLLLPLLFAVAIPLHAQNGVIDEFASQDMQPIRYKPEPPWIADMRPNPRFPITVRLSIEHGVFDGQKFVAGGEGHIFNPTAEDVDFKLRCDITFRAYRPVEFYGRWVTPGRKLEIRLRDPRSNHTRTCRVSTSLAAAATSP